ncbi:histone acetyltransferase HAC1-like [Salvia miltiorrhiza]|uniref:histone acetyltransferase HAC1-like n=1 Tax=Salvia miltiorrhiza TaxID=226208 RepID=UPI0025AC7FD1|nr:histone acetyltransferase HAC1-like [Salvia miltiorrhiza]
MEDEQLETVERRPRNCHASDPPLARLRINLDAVAHAAQCESRSCKHLKCGMAKKMFRHVIVCRRGAGGCRSFDTTLRLLHAHTQACQQSNCNCRDLAERLMKRRQKHESSRMLRQQVERLAELQLHQPDAASTSSSIHSA